MLLLRSFPFVYRFPWYSLNVQIAGFVFINEFKKLKIILAYEITGCLKIVFGGVLSIVEFRVSKKSKIIVFIPCSKALLKRSSF